MEAICLNTHPHILLAEDNLELRELLSFALTRAGYLVSSCDNGLALLEKLQQPLDYDLILSDLRMPALTGLEVLEFLHDLPHPPGVRGDDDVLRQETWCGSNNRQTLRSG